jgi:hypothetical protein
MSLSQDLNLHTGQHKHRKNAYTDNHILSGIRTQDPSVRASEDNSCLKPRGHNNLPMYIARQGSEVNKLEASVHFTSQVIVEP